MRVLWRRVVFALHDLGIITRDTKIGGASAGSLIAACYHSGLSQELVMESCYKLAEGEVQASMKHRDAHGAAPFYSLAERSCVEHYVRGVSLAILVGTTVVSPLATSAHVGACECADCRENGTRGRLGIVVREFLEKLLPEDIHERCNNRC